MLQFNRYVVRPSSTQLCIHVRELHLNSSDICSNVHLRIAVEFEEIRHQQTQSLSTALLIHTDEFVLKNRIEWYRIEYNRSSSPSGPDAPRP